MRKLFLSLLFLSSISIAALAQKGRVYVATNFTGISYSLPVNLQVVIGDKYEIKAVGSVEDVDLIVVEKNGNSLILKSKSGRHRFDSDTKIYVSLPKLSMISSAGSGRINVNDVVKGESLEVSLAGSGEIQLQAVDLGEISVSVAGSGNVKVGEHSKVNLGVYKIAGSGNISFLALQAKNVNVNIAGSGNVNAYASEKLTVKIVGSGNVTCTGSPKSVDKVKFGSGSVNIR